MQDNLKIPKVELLKIVYKNGPKPVQLINNLMNF